MKITKRQLRKLVLEAQSTEATYVSPDVVSKYMREIEAKLNELSDMGMTNDQLVIIMEEITQDIRDGFVGEST
tara:strand:+ start:5840 stop:6058 length:219 start_codon:yes stop_codon:yes gene_type:complete